MKKLICFLFILNVLACCGKLSSEKEDIEEKRYKTAFGVEMNGCNRYSVYLKNENAFPVRVRVVGIGNYGAEWTKSMTHIPAQGATFVENTNPNEGYYIYNLEGGLIGWMNGRCAE